MKFVIEASLVLTLLSGLAVWLYWAVLFPCLALKSRFQIQQISDEAYLARREGRISSISFMELEYFLDLGRRVPHHYEMLGLARKIKPQRHELEDLKKRINAMCKDDPKIRDIFSGITRWMLALYLASNPVEFLKLGFLVICAYFSDWAASESDREKKEIYTRASVLPA